MEALSVAKAAAEARRLARELYEYANRINREAYAPGNPWISAKRLHTFIMTLQYPYDPQTMVYLDELTLIPPTRLLATMPRVPAPELLQLPSRKPQNPSPLQNPLEPDY